MNRVAGKDERHTAGVCTDEDGHARLAGKTQILQLALGIPFRSGEAEFLERTVEAPCRECC